jgi:hypothetical protein
MPTNITVSISDEGLPIVQAALDADNDYRRREALRPELTLEQFIQELVDTAYHIKPEHIEAKELAEAKAELQAKVDTLDLKGIQAMTEAAIGIGIKAEPIEDVLSGGVEIVKEP